MVESGEIGFSEVMNFFFVEQPQTPLEVPPFNENVKPMFKSIKTFVKKFLRQKGLSLATPTSGRGASSLTLCKSSSSTLLRRGKLVSLLADRCANTAASLGARHVAVAVELKCDVSFSRMHERVWFAVLTSSPSLFRSRRSINPLVFAHRQRRAPKSIPTCAATSKA